MLDVNYKYITDEMEEKMIKRRRDFHRYPEDGWTEYRTTAKVAEILKELGYEVRLGKDVCDTEGKMGVPQNDVLRQCENRALEEGVSPEYLDVMKNGCTGAIGIINGGSPGKVTALRFDMDALPIKENTDKPYSSCHDQVMHACGHDGHTSVGLAVAQCLAQNRDRISGEVRIIFQPAEEGCRGAESIVKKGWLDDVDIFLSGHIGISCRRLGEIAVCKRGFFATTKMNIVFKGKAAHAGKVPEAGNNALLAAAVFTTNVYAISRTGKGDTRINVGKFISGNGRNIIADKAYLEVETRGTNAETNEYMKEAVGRIIKGVAEMYDVTYDIDIVGNVGSASSDDALAESLYGNVNEMNLGDYYIEDADMGASEDAVAMMRKVQEHGGQAVYYLFGSELAAEHHQNAFDFNEGVLPIMAEFYARAVIDGCNRKEVANG